MANVVDGQIEWLKEESTGVPVGFKKKDGTEGGLVTSQFNELTGGIDKYAGGVLVETTVTLAEYNALVSGGQIIAGCTYNVTA